MESKDDLPLGKKAKETLARELPKSFKRYEDGDTLYFDGLLKPKDAWRLFSSFPERCVCFDIETTGLSARDDDITVICTYRPATRSFATFVRHENLDEFPSTLNDGDVLVGFNSRSFDMPFIKAEFGEQLPKCARLDIRWVLKAMGIKGGLKEIERERFKITRPPGLEEYDGEEAVEAWYEWIEEGDRRARENLIRYCAADTFVLDFLVREACRMHGCGRFRTVLDPSSLFRTADPESWVAVLPDIAIGEEVASSQPVDVIEKVSSHEEFTYGVVFAMVLVDGTITPEEQYLLDLFATTYDLSTAEKQRAEAWVRDVYSTAGIKGMVTRIVERDRSQALRDLDQLLMFSIVDESIHSNEATFILAVAQALDITQEDLNERGRVALQRARDITARMT